MTRNERRVAVAKLTALVNRAEARRDKLDERLRQIDRKIAQKEDHLHALKDRQCEVPGK